MCFLFDENLKRMWLESMTLITIGIGVLLILYYPGKTMCFLFDDNLKIMWLEVHPGICIHPCRNSFLANSKPYRTARWLGLVDIHCLYSGGVEVVSATVSAIMLLQKSCYTWWQIYINCYKFDYHYGYDIMYVGVGRNDQKFQIHARSSFLGSFICK